MKNLEFPRRSDSRPAAVLDCLEQQRSHAGVRCLRVLFCVAIRQEHYIDVYLVYASDRMYTIANSLMASSLGKILAR
jgi:hypothetical protein